MSEMKVVLEDVIRKRKLAHEFNTYRSLISEVEAYAREGKYDIALSMYTHAEWLYNRIFRQLKGDDEAQKALLFHHCKGIKRLLEVLG